MSKSLYFICPTDNLELIIFNEFKAENYYYTSLGNSISFGDNRIVGQIMHLIQTKGIKNIVFILSDDNPILLDALRWKEHSNIQGLNKFYGEILEKKENVQVFWQNKNQHHLILSYHLYSKIKDLQTVLTQLLPYELTFGGKIYNRGLNRFTNIYFDLICEHVCRLN